MKTWQSVLLNIGLIFASVFTAQIKNPAIQTATATSIAAVAAVAAKVNSESDQAGNKLPPAGQ